MKVESFRGGGRGKRKGRGIFGKYFFFFLYQTKRIFLNIKCL